MIFFSNTFYCRLYRIRIKISCISFSRQNVGLYNSTDLGSMIGQMAEWSKALESGSSLFGGVGSNPTLLTFSGHSRHCFWFIPITHAHCLRKIRIRGDYNVYKGRCTSKD
jgi:hypothetical protein